MMRGFFAGLLAAILAVAPAVEAVASFRVTHLYGFGAGGSEYFSVVAQGTASGSIITVSDVSFGAPDPNRWIIVAVVGGAGGTASYGYDSANDQINGSNATTNAAAVETGGSNECFAAIMSANVTTGSTGSFRTVSSRSGSIRYVVYRLITTSGSVTQSVADTESGPNDGADLNVNTAVGDVVIAHATFNTSGTLSSTGLSVEVVKTTTRLFGYHISTASESPRTIDIDSTDTSENVCGVAASFIVAS